MNKKGQALVEFVLILPIFILLLFVIYDFGMIFNKKNELLSNTSDIVSLYKSDMTISEIESMYKGLEINIIDDANYKKLTVTNKIELITPGLNRIMGNPYVIKIERYIPNETE